MNEYANDERPGLPKGPWFVGSLPPPTWRYICGADGNVIASVAEWDSTGNLMQEFGGAVQAKAVAEAIAAIPNTQAEIDRLRTENERLRERLACTEDAGQALLEYKVELDRLRAEVEGLKQARDEQTDLLQIEMDESASLLAESERLRAEKAEANNQWRLDYNACAAERDRLRAANERLLKALKEIKQLNEMSGFNGCAIAEVYSKHLPNPPRKWKYETK